MPRESFTIIDMGFSTILLKVSSAILVLEYAGAQEIFDGELTNQPSTLVS